MSHFITDIQINKIFHLENIHIPIDKKEKKHLIITGKNGSGKTSLLISLKELLSRIINDSTLQFLRYGEFLDSSKIRLEQLINQNAPHTAIHQQEQNFKYHNEQFQNTFGKVNINFTHIIEISKLVHANNFVMAIYEANRKTLMNKPPNPEKPNLKTLYQIQDNTQQEFLKFLVDLKVQEALARNENDEKYADEIRVWFDNFTNLLKDIFGNSNVQLEFNFKDYSFSIIENNKCFGFNELSDGYSAIIDIVADLILKMQSPDNITRAFQKEGIVLIDEIETHLHLELQKTILPFLTKVFPNIQFIVTTHSPFVLSSIDNAVAYDLEKQESLDDLSTYSYEALAEGYFNVSSESSHLDCKLKRFEELLDLVERDMAETKELKNLDEELGQLDKNLTPENILEQYLLLKVKYPIK
ncbi:AAA family ATPase [Carboxylicivirga marina]|uniref:AAA family ATPase n=1 Tax=Carboxylicivirga marina TaxID=2800988 RepID=A0ABS1HMD5_9BACT|nr:AAA family ATPase [Carboxylicivirga marina]MBK3518786.1 AAA family ATPase [Carboxylicivirga marina]